MHKLQSVLLTSNDQYNCAAHLLGSLIRAPRKLDSMQHIAHIWFIEPARVRETSVKNVEQLLYTTDFPLHVNLGTHDLLRLDDFLQGHTDLEPLE